MNKLFVFALISIVFFACEDKIELDVPEGDKKLVVDGLLSNADSMQTVTLSLTSDYFDTNPTPKVSNATVYVTTNNNDTLEYTESNLEPGVYTAVYHLIDSNLFYQLHIVTPDGNVYESHRERLNRVPKIDSLVQSDEAAKEQGDFLEEGYVGLLTTKEPKGAGDYYRWVIILNGEQLIDPFNLIVRDDRLVDGNVIKDWDIVYGLLPGDIVEVRQMSISERAYNYWTLIFAQITNFGGPFSTPPAPVEGNVYNVNDANETVLGFFGVSKVEKATLTVVQK